jgi:hypothetical protein
VKVPLQRAASSIAFGQGPNDWNDDEGDSRALHA